MESYRLCPGNVSPGAGGGRYARRVNLSAVCALALAIGFSLPGHGQDSTTPSPSLGDVAKQAQAQKDKDKAKSNPAAQEKVFTNDDLSGGGFWIVGASATSLRTCDVAAQPGSPSPVRRKPRQGWCRIRRTAPPPRSPAEQLAQVAALLDRLDSLDRATLAKNVQGNDADFPGRDSWEDKLFAAKQAFVGQEREIMKRAKQLEAFAGLAEDPNDPLTAKELNNQLGQLINASWRSRSSATFQANRR